MTQLYMCYAQQKPCTHNVDGAWNVCTLTFMHITGRYIPWYMVPLRPPIYATTIYYHPKVHTGYIWMLYRYLIMPQLVAKQLCSWCFKCVFYERFLVYSICTEMCSISQLLSRFGAKQVTMHYRIDDDTAHWCIYASGGRSLWRNYCFTRIRKKNKFKKSLFYFS